MTSSPTLLRFLTQLARQTLALTFVLWGVLTAQAAPVVFPTNTVAVTLDGVTLGTQTTGSGLRNTVVRGDDGRYHLWTIKNGTDSYLSRTVHATSINGIHFTTQGLLQPPANYWQSFACGAQAQPTAEPIASFLRVSQVAGQWVLMVWHQNQTGQTWFSYNSSAWLIGADPDQLALNAYGPLPTTTCGTLTAPGRFHIGVFGVVDSHVYLRHVPQAGALPGALGGNLGRYSINLSVPPPTTSPRPAADVSVPKQTLEAELFAGTGFYEVSASPPANAVRALVYNAGRTVPIGSTLGTYYSFADYNTLAALEKDLWYVESTDGGASWSAPSRIYGTSGSQVLVDGLLAAGNFSAPDVTTDGRTYFMTRDACNNAVMVTAADVAADPRLSITLQYSPSTITAGESSELSITVQAPVGCTPAPASPIVTNLAYLSQLPAGLQLTGSVISNSCTGTVNAIAGSTSLGLEGTTLTANQSCTTVVQVRAPDAGQYSTQILIAAVSNDQDLAPANDATATLSVTQQAAPAPIPTPTTSRTLLAALLILLAAVAYTAQQRT